MHNKPNTKKTQLTANNYVKKFETFNEMVKELKSLHTEIEDIFREYEDDETIDPILLTDDVVAYFTNNTPDVVNGNDLPVSASFSANKVSLKTAKFFSIGWMFKFDKDGTITDISAKVTVFLKENHNNEKIESMSNYLNNTENGWKLVEYNK